MSNFATCEFCGCIYAGKFMYHYCPPNGIVKQISTREALEAFIVAKEAGALALLGKDTGYVEE